jgi:CRISPR system Cascade subunit CasB
VYAFPFVERFTINLKEDNLKEDNLKEERRKLYFLVAGLFATHPESSKDPKENLGRTLKRLYIDQGEAPSTEKRFLALLEADDNQLPEHLRHLVNLLKSKGLAVNWQRLLQDLINRQYDQDETKKRWAQSFYRPLNEEAETTQEPVVAK